MNAYSLDKANVIPIAKYLCSPLTASQNHMIPNSEIYLPPFVHSLIQTNVWSLHQGMNLQCVSCLLCFYLEPSFEDCRRCQEPATKGKAVLTTTHGEPRMFCLSPVFLGFLVTMLGDLEIELWATETPKAGTCLWTSPFLGHFRHNFQI